MPDLHQHFGFKSEETEPFRRQPSEGPELNQGTHLREATIPLPKVKAAPAPDPIETAYKAYSKSPGPETTGQVLKAAEPILHSGMTSFGQPGPLMKSRARLLAVQALKSYKPESGVKLNTWIFQNLKGLTRYGTKSSPITAPERARYDLYRLEKVKSDFADEHGRDPTDIELGDLSGLSVRRISKLQRENHAVINEGSLKDDDGAQYLPGVSSNHPEAIWAEYVYHDLDHVNKQIYTLMMQKKLGVSDIAKKLKITPSAVSQRASKIATLLDQFHTLK